MSAFGEGTLSRGSALVYTLLVVEGLFLLTAAPGFALLLLLDRDGSNVALFALCAVPLGPAVSAAVYALHRRRSDLADLHPAAAFWRGYRLNAVGVLKVWLPTVALLAVLAVSLVNRAASGVPLWWSALLLVIGAAVVLWSVNALVIASLYVFRTGDVARLAAYFLGHRPGVALGSAGLLLTAGAITVLASEAVALLPASLLVGGLLLVARPMCAEIERRFIDRAAPASAADRRPAGGGLA
ncbi:hypothetical protein [Dactylosporangium matsuzakiense]|uniref:DUF624 domain-containing protein n=1 Tax=Dactylosporangium matsuzakiense TaxID=53360 RepID=A0A9W6KSQ1_9ACTN|nr:hypothetical protein [Dactylosporangium matsuzakiense]UWZ48615.1 DUF624 domain-containing protein [Dactylosporangium matsuzakiense]GLL06450.1 hypothetical protein GCM10017581_082000 [Dactylosporangium matsuzakiense]